MVRLTRGRGSPSEGGCWMVACSIYEAAATKDWKQTIKENWSDLPASVDAHIRDLCVYFNDLLSSDRVRESVIGPHLLTPIGTATSRLGDLHGAALNERAEIFSRAMRRRWLPFVLDYLRLGPKDLTERLRAGDACWNEVSARASGEKLGTRRGWMTTAASLAMPSAYRSFDSLTFPFNIVDAVEPGDERDRFLVDEVLPVILDLCRVHRAKLIPARAKGTRRVLARTYDGREVAP